MGPWWTYQGIWLISILVTGYKARFIIAELKGEPTNER